MKALSIQHPWASLIINGYKRVENRTRSTKYRGPVLIHAGKKIDDVAMVSVNRGYHPVVNARCNYQNMDFPIGGIIGQATIVDCVTELDDPYFVGPYGFILNNVKSLPLQPCHGMLGFFTPGADWTPPDYLNQNGSMLDAKRLGS